MHLEIISKKVCVRSSKFNINIARCLLFFVAATFLTSAYAQISQSAHYLGKIGSTDFHVFVSENGGTAFFEYLSGVEQGSGPLGANSTATFVTNRNRQVTVRVQGNTVTGTFLNEAFSATKENAIGPFSGISGGYSGVLVETASGRTASNSSAMLVFPSGKVILNITAAVGGGITAGVGTLSESGAIALSLSSNFSSNGDVLRFTFRPDDDVAQGSATSALAPGNAYSYVLVRRKAATLINVSTRGSVTPTQLMTAGFVVTGGAKTVLIRAVGPTLSAFGVGNANADPRVTLYSGQTVISSNDNWSDASNANEIPAAAAQVGAFALTSSSRDAVLLVQLQPGAYTAQVASVGSAAGDALVEAYEVTR